MSACTCDPAVLVLCLLIVFIVLDQNWNVPFNPSRSFLRHDYEHIQDAVLGGDKVIDGLDEGLRGMCAGEKRLVTVPPHLGHGERGGEAAPLHFPSFVGNSTSLAFVSH